MLNEMKNDIVTIVAKRLSTDSQNTIIMTTTPELNLSNSDSTLNEEENNVSIESDLVKNTSLSSRVNPKRPSSIVSTVEPFQPRMERSISTSSFQSILGRKKSSKKQLKTDLGSTIEENTKNSFVTYLQNSTKLKKSLTTSTTTVDLGRSKSKKKWSIIHKNPPIPSLDQTTFLTEPNSLKDTTLTTTTTTTNDIMNKYLESMLNGGYISTNLYTPIDLW